MLLTPLIRALSQFDDAVFVGVVWRSVAWSVACFAALYAGVVWTLNQFIHVHGWLGWLADLLGIFGASILTIFLFLPVAATIGYMYSERIAQAVERRYYPQLPPPAAAEAVPIQLWDGIIVGVQVLGLNLLALILTFVLPGVGFILGWFVAAYAIGRGLFVAVAMRRMPRVAAESAYRANRLTVLAQGAVLAAAATIPLMNLLIPVIGIAVMVHVLDLILATAHNSEPFRRVVNS